MVKHPPTSAGDTGSIPDPGRSHVPRSNQACAPGLLKTVLPRTRAPRQEKPQQRETRMPQPEKACAATRTQHGRNKLPIFLSLTNWMIYKLFLELLVFLTICSSLRIWAVGITCHEWHSLATDDIFNPSRWNWGSSVYRNRACISQSSGKRGHLCC